MGQVYFYHLTRQPVEQALPMLLDRSLANGWRVSVRGTNARRLELLDSSLWQGGADAFLPHGLQGGAHDSLQPILLGTSQENANAAVCVISIDGAMITETEVRALQRCCILFDGHDPNALDLARGQWKSLTDAGCGAQYWSQDSGRWEKKLDRPET
jgi:DNA polymerase-3 subunit chi